ncbi:hypothetical protein TRM7557_03668 [Tritonibacter multivorans]|uniref:Peptidase S8/S53 domain-containing protein n=1 Tax=Tritonibacter multivorans TaxID=928856 RepID=A0A0P1GJ47_9RHOB|nr:hypothetical protein [Tritonibacter multivorans]MDA7421682.1 hypothetical protein [Tritonibacter multivorans]CUH81944.1 hypothetical protein TRM7557_03668 [Tritonibacter multivorans]SFC91614.1 hypothetical protein SAMN04488049_10512 [Tritonibacter multivorans]
MKYDWSDPQAYPYWDYEYPYFYVNDRAQFLAAGLPLEDSPNQTAAANIGVLVQEFGDTPARSTLSSIKAIDDLFAKSTAQPRSAPLDVSNQYSLFIGGLAPVPESTANSAPPSASKSSSAYPVGAVAIGVVDSGMSFANARFRTKAKGTDPDKSRIEFLWLMGRKHAADGSQKIRKSQLDAWFAAHYDPATGLVDEDRIYQDIEVLKIDAGMRPRAEHDFAFPHGTQILDLAAGYPAEMQVNNRPILAVELPTLAVADTSGARVQGHLVDAVEEIFDQSRGLTDQNGDILPLALNISLAITAGPHDGSHPLEVTLDRLIEEERRQYGRLIEVFMPAGNHRQDRLHAKMHLTNKTPQAFVDWEIYPDDRTASFTEVWLPIDKAQYEAQHCLLQVQLTPPGGTQTAFTAPTAPGEMRILQQGGDPQANVFFSRHIGRNGFFERIVIGVQATEQVLPDATAARSGAWKIGLQQAGGTDLSPDLWIQRDETLPGFRSRGRQSRFADVPYEKYDTDGRRPLKDGSSSSVITRHDTGSAMATGRYTTLVAAQRDRVDGPFDAEYSGHSEKPKSALAVVDQKIFSRGVLATGRRSGSVAPISGTSAASALVTRRRADELEADSKGTHTAQFYGSRELFRWIV